MHNRGIKFLNAIFAIAIILLLPNIAAACPRCFGAGVDTPITRGITMAMFSLILIIGCVLGGIVLFFLQMHRRTKLYENEQWAVSENGELIKVKDQNLTLDLEDVDAEIDKLLDKINLIGYNSLTYQDKEMLKKAAKLKQAVDVGKGV